MSTTDGMTGGMTGATGSAQGTDGPTPVPPSRPGKQAKPEKRPLYPRLLRLRHVHPNAWQRALLGEGALGVAALLCLADVASLWTLVVLPVAVAVVVKAHDLLAGVLAGGRGSAHGAPAGESAAAGAPAGGPADPG